MRGIEPRAADGDGGDHRNSGALERAKEIAGPSAAEAPPPNHHVDELLGALSAVGAVGLGAEPDRGSELSRQL